MAPLVKLESWSTWILKLEEASEGKESQKKNSPLNSRAPCSTFPPPHHCTNGQSDESMSQESQALVMKTRRLLIDGEDEAVMERSYIRSLEMTNTLNQRFIVQSFVPISHSFSRVCSAIQESGIRIEDWILLF
ncbi:hypothetical protein R6Q59_023782 [Mikania micrantha]